MKKIILYLYLAIALASLFACIKNGGEVISKNGLDQAGKDQGIEAILGTQGIVPGSFVIRDLKITPDGKELYLGASNSNSYTILVSRKIDGRWTEPEIVKSIENPECINIMTLFNPDKHII